MKSTFLLLFLLQIFSCNRIPAESRRTDVKESSGDSFGLACTAEDTTIEIVNGVMQKCCSSPTNPVIPGKKICQHFAFDFHNECMKQPTPLKCKTVRGQCGKDVNPHRFNLVFINGLWYVADPTNETEIFQPGFPDSNKIPPELLCKAFLLETGSNGMCMCPATPPSLNKTPCECVVDFSSDVPVLPSTDPGYCAAELKPFLDEWKDYPAFLKLCTNCCAERASEYSGDKKEYLRKCISACANTPNPNVNPTSTGAATRTFSP